MITVKIGNLLASSAQTLVNTVNCAGVMGKGIALEFKKQFPAMFQDYLARCEAGQVQLGIPYLFTDLLGSSILNFPTKKHWRSPSRLQDIVQGLDYFVAHYEEWGIQSIAFPPLGCGNGGLDWSDVGPLMYAKLQHLPISIEIYAPYGTPHHQLTAQFLTQTAVPNSHIVGVKHPKLKDEWLALLEVVYLLSLEPYAPPVGRTIFQKICYIMTELGLETGFTFEQGSYGPFSEDINSALTVIANANLIQEQQLGPMTALLTGTEYKKIRREKASQLATFQKWIDKTVDLFSRIKNTAQAEEVTTVLYTARKLKKERGKENVSEQDVLEFILDWKKKWSKETISATIRHLEMLGWLELTYSDSLVFDLV